MLFVVIASIFAAASSHLFAAASTRAAAASARAAAVSARLADEFADCAAAVHVSLISGCFAAHPALTIANSAAAVIPVAIRPKIRILSPLSSLFPNILPQLYLPLKLLKRFPEYISYWVENPNPARAKEDMSLVFVVKIITVAVAMAATRCRFLFLRLVSYRSFGRDHKTRYTCSVLQGRSYNFRRIKHPCF